jgi:Ser/Thr protein kinase RdoA (MazF antagonist)
MDEGTEAATHWGGTGLRLIRNRENAVYEMRLPGGARAALRLHRTGYQDAAAIRSELWWCAELARAGLPVPEPLAAKAGDPLVTLSTGRFASVIAWVEGEPMGEAGHPLPGTATEQADRHHALGRLVASVHQATDAMTLPAEFTRPRWDTDGLTGDSPFWGRFWDHPALTPAEADRMLAARDFLRAGLTDHARTGGNVGPIHADVLRENVLVNENSLSLIDFDDSGIGFRLYDLGTVMSQNLYQPNRTALRDALVAGYAGLRSVDSETVDLFTLARVLASVGWTMPRLGPGDPIHRRHIDRALMWLAEVAGSDI